MNTFLSPEDLRTVIYEYQLEQITEGDESIVQAAIGAAIEEIKAYLSQRYDMKSIYQATGEQRNSLILSFTKTLTLWHIIQLSNTEIIYDKAKGQYDRVISFLTNAAKGITNPDLPLLGGSESSQVQTLLYGGMKPSIYDY